MTHQPVSAALPIALIRVGARLREIDDDNVDLLAVSMEDIGLHTPVWVREADSAGMHDLIAGAHRYAAAVRLGWAEMPALVFQVDGLDARLMEIDENLIRRELSELDRAVFLAERKSVYEALHPETRRGGDRTGQTDKAVSLIPSFADATARKLGVDARTVYRAVARARNIADDVRRTIGPTWIAAKGANLDALARLDPEDQRRVIALMLAVGGPRTVGAAVVQMRGTPADQDESEQQLAALMKAWRRAGAKARDGFVEFLSAEGVIEAEAREAA